MRNAIEGTYNTATTFCPVNAYGECPYCDQCNICHIENPQLDCDDWQVFFDSWAEWEALDRKVKSDKQALRLMIQFLY